MTGCVINEKQNFWKQVKGKKIICFGAGNILKQFLKGNEYWSEKIDCIIDNKISNQIKYIEYSNRKIPVVSAGYLKKISVYNYVILITCAAVDSILNQLRKLAIPEKLIFTVTYYQEYPVDDGFKKQLRLDMVTLKILSAYLQDFKVEDRKKEIICNDVESKLQNDDMIIPYMTALVTSKCTLKCRDCNNLVPYCHNSKFISKEIIIQDVTRICSVIDFCICMNITGGEPFLHPDLDKIIAEITDNSKILFVEVITNGTVMPSQEVIKSIRNSKVIIKISRYENFSKIDKLISLFEDEGIRYLVLDNLSWRTSGGIERRNKRYDQIKKEYLSCWPGKHCKSMWEGNLYPCARAAFLHEVGADCKDDSLNLSIGNRKLKKKLLEFYLREYMDACDFCDQMNSMGHKVEPAIQIED